ncbi:Imm50 family immunity protein [Streptomyces sp. NPDC050564]|uniref:Imm50 family immunity protein n=1 Tax=Streptomyces sp. NPDC050564 TaxID=3365631 RepID=UPI0037A12962
MTVDDFLVNPEVLQALYGCVPHLSGVTLRSINLDWCGHTVTLRIDLPSFPGSAPREWIDAGMDAVQCQLQFLAVEKISLTDWAPPAVGDINLAPWGRERRMRVTVSGSGVALGFHCNESVTVGHVSAFKVKADGSDSGRHFFVGKVDARRYSALPGPDDRTFYAR